MTTLNYPPPSLPVAMSDGTMNPVWYRWLLTMFDRTGGTAGTPTDVSALQVSPTYCDSQPVQIGDVSPPSTLLPGVDDVSPSPLAPLGADAVLATRLNDIGQGSITL